MQQAHELHLPDDIETLQSYELSLCLYRLPAQISQATSLTHLDLHNNALTDFTALAPLTNLESLVLARIVNHHHFGGMQPKPPTSSPNRTEPQTLPGQFRISFLTNLRRLDLSHNCLDDWPSMPLDLLPLLEHIDLSGNWLRNVQFSRSDSTSTNRTNSKLWRQSLWSTLRSFLFNNTNGASASSSSKPQSRHAKHASSSLGMPLCHNRLSVLDLSNCRLGALPETVLRTFCSLTQLNLANNHDLMLVLSDSAVDPAIESLCNLTQLRSLNLTECPLAGASRSNDVAAPFASLFENLSTSIESLYLGASYVHRSFLVPVLPPQICRLVNLRHLNLSGCGISALPEEMGNALVLLEQLDISKNLISRALPSSFSLLRRLRELVAHHNQLTVFPFAQLRGMPELRILNLDYNQIEALTDDDCDTPGCQNPLLEKLRLSFNGLSVVPNWMFTDSLASSLCTLHLRGNRLKSLPVSISKLASLRSLKLEDNRLSGPLFSSSVASDISAGRLLPSLEKLCLNANNLRTPPFELVGLRTLNMSQNSIDDIDVEKLLRFTRLEVLHLDQNDLGTPQRPLSPRQRCADSCDSDPTWRKLHELVMRHPQLKIVSLLDTGLSHSCPHLNTILECIRTRPQGPISLRTRCIYPDEIIDNLLFIGNWETACNRVVLRDLGITHMITIADQKPPRHDFLLQKWISLPDVNSTNLLPYFDECIEFINEARDMGGACYVHCMAGISRSVTIVTAYLMSTVSGLQSFSCAFKHVKSRRPIACPNAGFRSQLLEFEQQLAIQQG